MPIEHIVVLMLENRSFDNVLGSLYAPGNAPPYQQPPPGQAGFDGIPPGASNPGPTGPVFAHNQTSPSTTGPGQPAWAPTTIPIVDPGEYFADMAQQLIGLDAVPTSPPWAGYSPAGPSSAQGYVTNYSQLGGSQGALFKAQQKPLPANYPDVMNCFTPAQLPVTAFLANRYGLSDTWFGSVPSHTYVNRSFALSAAPAVAGPVSFIDDTQYFKASVDLGNPPLVPIQEMPTILSQLDEAMGAAGMTGPFWKVYFHDYSIAYDTIEYVRATVAAGAGLNVGTFDDSDWGSRTPTQLGSSPVATSFVQDLQNRALPPFSWIEPRYFDNWAPTGLPPNSNHPGSAAKVFVRGAASPIDAATGEVLLMELYNLLRASPLWETTLLIVTYDEHGGIWDHVPPPYATPPGHGIPGASYPLDPLLHIGDPAAEGFTYNVFGGRLPAIVVSPMVPPGSLFRADTPFDHTSIIRTVRDVFLAPLGATAPLTDRDAAAPSLLPGLTASPVNDTGFFEGTIVAGPASLYFRTLLIGATAQTVFAGAGPGFPLGASASQPPGESWLSVSATGPTGTFAVTADPHGTHGLGSYYGQVQFFSTGATAAANSPVVVPVRLDVTL